MNILYIIKSNISPTVDFKSDMYWDLVHEIIELGHNVTLISAGKPWAELTVPQIILSHGSDRKLVEAELYEADRQANGYDVIFADCAGNNTVVLASLISEILNIPFVVREHRNYLSVPDHKTPDWKNALFIDSLNKSSLILAVSPLQADSIVMQLGLNVEIKILENHVPIGIELYSGARTQLHSAIHRMKGSRFVFAAWTRWRYIKRLDVLIQAFDLFCNKNAEAVLFVAGKIEFGESLMHSLINKYPDNVYYLGNLTRPEIYDLAAMTDCNIMPSDFETFGLPMLESLAMGAAVIATKCQGPLSVLPSFKNSLLIENNNASELSDSMDFIFRNFDKGERREIKERALGLFSVRVLAKKLVIYLEEVISKRLA